jgi:hypothetical protein
MVCMLQIMEFCGGNSENSTGAYVGIEPSRVMVKIVNHKNQGIDAGVVFRPIAFKTRLGQARARYYLFGPFGFLNQGCNSKIAKVTSVASRVCARSGSDPKI